MGTNKKARRSRSRQKKALKDNRAKNPASSTQLNHNDSRIQYDEKNKRCEEPVNAKLLPLEAVTHKEIIPKHDYNDGSYSYQENVVPNGGGKKLSEKKQGTMDALGGLQEQNTSLPSQTLSAELKKQLRLNLDTIKNRHLCNREYKVFNDTNDAKLHESISPTSSCSNDDSDKLVMSTDRDSRSYCVASSLQKDAESWLVTDEDTLNKVWNTASKVCPGITDNDSAAMGFVSPKNVTKAMRGCSQLSDSMFNLEDELSDSEWLMNRKGCNSTADGKVYVSNEYVQDAASTSTGRDVSSDSQFLAAIAAASAVTQDDPYPTNRLTTSDSIQNYLHGVDYANPYEVALEASLGDDDLLNYNYKKYSHNLEDSDNEYELLKYDDAFAAMRKEYEEQFYTEDVNAYKNCSQKVLPAKLSANISLGGNKTHHVKHDSQAKFCLAASSNNSHMNKDGINQYSVDYTPIKQNDYKDQSDDGDFGTPNSAFPTSRSINSNVEGEVLPSHITRHLDFSDNAAKGLEHLGIKGSGVGMCTEELSTVLGKDKLVRDTATHDPVSNKTSHQTSPGGASNQSESAVSISPKSSLECVMSGIVGSVHHLQESLFDENDQILDKENNIEEEGMPAKIVANGTQIVAGDSGYGSDAVHDGVVNAGIKDDESFILKSLSVKDVNDAYSLAAQSDNLVAMALQTTVDPNKQKTHEHSLHSYCTHNVSDNIIITQPDFKLPSISEAQGDTDGDSNTTTHSEQDTSSHKNQPTNLKSLPDVSASNMSGKYTVGGHQIKVEDDFLHKVINEGNCIENVTTDTQIQSSSIVQGTGTEIAIKTEDVNVDFTAFDAIGTVLHEAQGGIKSEAVDGNSLKIGELQSESEDDDLNGFTLRSISLDDVICPSDSVIDSLADEIYTSGSPGFTQTFVTQGNNKQTVLNEYIDEDEEYDDDDDDEDPTGVNEQTNQKPQKGELTPERRMKLFGRSARKSRFFYEYQLKGDAKLSTDSFNFAKILCDLEDFKKSVYVKQEDAGDPGDCERNRIATHSALSDLLSSPSLQDNKLDATMTPKIEIKMFTPVVPGRHIRIHNDKSSMSYCDKVPEQPKISMHTKDTSDDEKFDDSTQNGYFPNNSNVAASGSLADQNEETHLFNTETGSPNTITFNPPILPGVNATPIMGALLNSPHLLNSSDAVPEQTSTEIPLCPKSLLDTPIAGVAMSNFFGENNVHNHSNNTILVETTSTTTTEEYINEPQVKTEVAQSLNFSEMDEEIGMPSSVLNEATLDNNEYHINNEQECSSGVGSTFAFYKQDQPSETNLNNIIPIHSPDFKMQFNCNMDYLDNKDIDSAQIGDKGQDPSENIDTQVEKFPSPTNCSTPLAEYLTPVMQVPETEIKDSLEENVEIEASKNLQSLFDAAASDTQYAQAVGDERSSHAIHERESILQSEHVSQSNENVEHTAVDAAHLTDYTKIDEGTLDSSSSCTANMRTETSNEYFSDVNENNEDIGDIETLGVNADVKPDEVKANKDFVKALKPNIHLGIGNVHENTFFDRLLNNSKKHEFQQTEENSNLSDAEDDAMPQSLYCGVEGGQICPEELSLTPKKLPRAEEQFAVKINKETSSVLASALHAMEADFESDTSQSNGMSCTDELANVDCFSEEAKYDISSVNVVEVHLSKTTTKLEDTIHPTSPQTKDGEMEFDTMENQSLFKVSELKPDVSLDQGVEDFTPVDKLDESVASFQQQKALTATVVVSENELSSSAGLSELKPKSKVKSLQGFIESISLDYYDSDDDEREALEQVKLNIEVDETSNAVTVYLRCHDTGDNNLPASNQVRANEDNEIERLLAERAPTFTEFKKLIEINNYQRKQVNFKRDKANRNNLTTQHTIKNLPKILNEFKLQENQATCMVFGLDSGDNLGSVCFNNSQLSKQCTQQQHFDSDDNRRLNRRVGDNGISSASPKKKSSRTVGTQPFPKSSNSVISSNSYPLSEIATNTSNLNFTRKENVQHMHCLKKKEFSIEQLVAEACEFVLDSDADYVCQAQLCGISALKQIDNKARRSALKNMYYQQEEEYKKFCGFESLETV